MVLSENRIPKIFVLVLIGDETQPDHSRKISHGTLRHEILKGISNVRKLKIKGKIKKRKETK